MANTAMLSPGVFTTENNLSFLPQGISQIGGAFVGPFLQGPAFVPITVTSQQDFYNRFGGTTPDFYTPYAVTSYLMNAAQAVVVRVLGLSGYNGASGSGGNASAILFVSGQGGQWPLGVLFPTQNAVSLNTQIASASGNPNNFTVSLQGTDATVTGSNLSAFYSASSYWQNYFGTDPTAHNEGFAILQFPGAVSQVSGAVLGSGSILIQDSAGRFNFSGSTYGIFQNAFSPVIRSQTVGNSRYNLFTVTAFDSGDESNSKVKISIANVRPDPLGLTFGQFSLLVRAFNDTDTAPVVLEQYTNLTLDSTSPNYIARAIGDSHYVINYTTGDSYLDGDFPPVSQYIYVTMDPGITSVPIQANPYGFEAPLAPLQIVGYSGIPTASYVQSRYSLPPGSAISVPNNNIYYGFNFTDPTSLAYLNPIPSGAVSNGAEFNLETVIDTDVSGSLYTTTGIPYRKFTIPLQGGFDGQDPSRIFGLDVSMEANNTQGFDLSTSTSPGTLAYIQALNSLSNQDAIDINLVVAPGVLYSLHPYVCQVAINLCEARGDCFYVMDNSQINDITTAAVSEVAGIDTTYAATYYPWMKILDTSLNQYIWVPPSVLMPQVYAFNDQIGAEWYAPAGLNRGGVAGAVAVRQRLAQTDRDTLYVGRVNPIATFPNQGIVVWGQKTLPIQPSALDRVNVRRLLIAVKKFIASSTRYLVFEQNTDATRQRFLNIVNPYLAGVQEQSGLYAFKVIMDDTNNPPNLIDQNILAGTLYLQPTKTAEFLALTFNILPTGATFPTD